MTRDRTLSPLDQLPARHEPLAKAKPFLMPRGGPNDTHTILPPEKENRKIGFKEEILVTEIENRFYLNDFPEDDEEGSYEIEIVDDDGDADFYLEIVDGEVFYVFETEDDISLESEGGSLDADGNPQSHQHDDKADNQHRSHPAKDEEEDINDQLNSSMFINFEDMMLAPDLDASDNNQENAGPPMEISFEPEPETMEDLNQGSQFMDLDNFMESSEEEEEEEEEETPQEGKSSGPKAEVEEESANKREENLRMMSEETLLLMDDDAEPESPPKRSSEALAIEQEESQEQYPVSVHEKAVSPIIPAKPQSDSAKVTDSRPVAPSRKASLTLDEKKVMADLKDGPKTSGSRMSSAGKSFEKVTVSTAPQSAEAKEVLTKQKVVNNAVISTESTTARMVRERSYTDASPEPSSPSKQSNDDDHMYSSPVQSSPTKTKSILKCNPASPVKTPRKDRNKPKKSTKTFSKTYVRADQLDGEHRVYTWAKPDWTNKKQELRPTGRAEALRKGKLEAPITFFPKKPVNEGLDSDADMGELVKKAMKAGSQATSIFGPKKNLKVSVNGAKLREGKDIVKPITKATVLRQPENINKVANPGVLKPTPTGEEVRKGATLAAPVTFPTLKYDDTNQIANPKVLRKGVQPAPKKQYEWSKPDWTKKAHLRNTPVGEAVKKGADLQGPITDAPQVRRRKSFDTLSVDSSDSGRSDEAIAPPRRGKRIVPPRTASMPSSTRSTDSGELSGASQRSSGSQEDSATNSYEIERLRKEKEQKERRERLARMARSWQNEE
mmetsp:Transcript_5975/g.11991  ORF Transcript_5975/g.11991 Transcript_5975/m.11991 type:complete len:782 (+) Transcript_5975:260-2605(+)